MKKRRKHCTPEGKVAILRRHLLGKEPISKLCDELGPQPKIFGIKQYGKFWNVLEASVSTWVVGPPGGEDLVVSRPV
jgi:transposase-like protein